MLTVRKTAGVGFAMTVLLAVAAAGLGRAEQTVCLSPITNGYFRWLDTAGNLYAENYRWTYDYRQGGATVTFRTNGTLLTGVLYVVNLKPNFAYQFKLEGQPETAPQANEALGYSGRWWQQEWIGAAWSKGANLNRKGNGTFPNLNDRTYRARKDRVHMGSPTGLRYRYTGYRPLDYFITDSQGHAVLEFTLDSAYHVLWRTNQLQYTWSSKDGPKKTASFDPDPVVQSAYDVDYPPSSATIYGEWERLPPNGIYLAPGEHTMNFLITEESFHGVDGVYSGNWAYAFRGAFTFTIVRPRVSATET